VADQGKTIVMVTHDMGLASRFTRSLTITDGELDSKETLNSELNFDRTMMRRRK
jgi:ABC-type lipoprotein export system ATPase subunit